MPKADAFSKMRPWTPCWPHTITSFCGTRTKGKKEGKGDWTRTSTGSKPSFKMCVDTTKGAVLAHSVYFWMQHWRRPGDNLIGCMVRNFWGSAGDSSTAKCTYRFYSMYRKGRLQRGCWKTKNRQQATWHVTHVADQAFWADFKDLCIVCLNVWKEEE